MIPESWAAGYGLETGYLDEMVPLGEGGGMEMDGNGGFWGRSVKVGWKAHGGAVRMWNGAGEGLVSGEGGRIGREGLGREMLVGDFGRLGRYVGGRLV